MTRQRPSVADDEEVGVQVPLPQGPGADLVGVVDATVAIGGIEEASADSAALAGADQFGLVGDPGQCAVHSVALGAGVSTAGKVDTVFARGFVTAARL
jgi:hypothetical protein